MKDDSTELLSAKEDTRKISTVRGSTVSEKTLDSYYKRFEVKIIISRKTCRDL